MVRFFDELFNARMEGDGLIYAIVFLVFIICIVIAVVSYAYELHRYHRDTRSEKISSLIEEWGGKGWNLSAVYKRKIIFQRGDVVIHFDL